MNTQKEIPVFDINKLLELKQLIDSVKPEYHYFVPESYLQNLRKKIEEKPPTPELPELKEFCIWQKLIEAGHATVTKSELGVTDIYRIRANTMNESEFKWPFTNLP